MVQVDVLDSGVPAMSAMSTMLIEIVDSSVINSPNISSSGGSVSPAILLFLLITSLRAGKGKDII